MQFKSRFDLMISAPLSHRRGYIIVEPYWCYFLLSTDCILCFKGSQLPVWKALGVKSTQITQVTSKLKINLMRTEPGLGSSYQVSIHLAHRKHSGWRGRDISVVWRNQNTSSSFFFSLMFFWFQLLGVFLSMERKTRVVVKLFSLPGGMR